jgi:hypothetical protein
MRSETIADSLDRYFLALQDARRTLKEQLTESELSLICDSCNGVIHTADTLSMLWGGIEDSIGLDHLDEKWEVDGKKLVKKLRDLSYIESCALTDAVERFWKAVSAGKNPKTGEIL